MVGAVRLLRLVLPLSQVLGLQYRHQLLFMEYILPAVVNQRPLPNWPYPLLHSRPISCTTVESKKKFYLVPVLRCGSIREKVQVCALRIWHFEVVQDWHCMYAETAAASCRSESETVVNDCKPSTLYITPVWSVACSLLAPKCADCTSSACLHR